MRPSNKIQNHTRRHFSLTLALFVIVGAAILVPGPAAFAAINSPPVWSTPVNLGSVINSASSDQGPAISPDGLSLYFASNRPGGLGGFDMYVTQRASVADPWGSAVNIGSLNTTFDEGNAAFSRDGRLLFFQSKRLPSLGGIDIWVAQRNNPRDDFAWQPAVNLGSGVNSAADDNGPSYFEDIARGTRQLYFGSARPGGPGGPDIYVSDQMADGSFGPAMLVTELSSPKTENRPSIRHDGLEIFFQSDRTGSIGTAQDLWVATRGSTLDVWSTPVNLGDTINTASVEQNSYLSSDGTTLFFASDRAGGFGGLDLYMSTRTTPTVYPSWSYTGNLNEASRFHTATLLPNGKVLLAGGLSNNNCSSGGGCDLTNSAELYDPATGTWSITGSLNKARDSHTATLLPNGKVLVAGGFFFNWRNGFGSAELYDPATGTWTITGDLNVSRASHTATLLPNGKVLVAGGFRCGPPEQGCFNLNSAELYDPATGTWNSTGNLNTAREGVATLLPDGKVLVAAGDDAVGHGSSAELYDPATGTWSLTGNLNFLHFGTSTLLPSGKVLFAGCDSDGRNSAELYDPPTGTWSSTGNLKYARCYHTATLLANGRVLVAGGIGNETLGSTISSAELYDPATETWSPTAYLNMFRWDHRATLLPNGKVLVAGGEGVGYQNTNTAELYDATSSPNINFIDDARFFVDQHYIDFLNREPDASGVAFWINEITSCGGDAQCIELKRINVSAAFFLSIEFQETGFFVYRVNKAAHGNLPGLPVPVKLNELLPEMAEVGQRVIVGQPGWEQVLESNKQVFLVNDPETDRWTDAYPTSLTPSEFVDTVFANAEVIPSASDRSLAINEFGSATTTGDLLARARALRRVAENPTLKQQELNRAFVLMQYFGYLRRNPNDPPEATLDFQGYNFWLTKLNQFNGNFINAEMVKAFLVSTEYRQRFGP